MLFKYAVVPIFEPSLFVAQYGLWMTGNGLLPLEYGGLASGLWTIILFLFVSCDGTWQAAGLDALNCWIFEFAFVSCRVLSTCVFLCDCECVVLLSISYVSPCGWLKTSTYPLLLINYFVRFYLYAKICVVWVYTVILYILGKLGILEPEIAGSIFQSCYPVTILITWISQNPNYLTRTNRVTRTPKLRCNTWYDACIAALSCFVREKKSFSIITYL